MEQKGRFYAGAALLVGFAVVLALVFLPGFKGENALQYLDRLYNSISKGSVYYIPKAKEASEGFVGSPVSTVLSMADEVQTEQTSRLFMAAGARVTANRNQLNISGDLGRILASCLVDAEAMYHNESEKVSGRYGYDERHVLYNWWCALKEMDRHFRNEKRFRECNVIDLVQKKAVEPAYNFYSIESQKISDRLGLVLSSLIFYVVYTLWYGFAIMYIFEGLGLSLEH
jgi:hypothetical protein